ncbi:tyrosine--tRNA ligase [Opitutus terrae]|uniref:Tyrosine--tRNA ligase n=1 Tax=Opitutus terrae (strain DSM 11246 / JCM 15787 / PB90-1) TaxID=452637 RepID=SYY_OPITP|nr:tyrosine--tRNA ligase [Opitutus terrae]B1ZUZ4.1 RecName: Full=Tyrosine--tRNA ligase; AltName: Full=Tyrosyl-tRNA synthetase; Short=TyrRS [Opitutus terrae PB90-1]ACB75964.1 tyrosyl-tRNA synthetase [Opitutus terrae PB90-1]
MTILDDLQWRGLYADCTDLAALTQRLGQGPVTLYCGFDPTADSLHVGNLVPLLALRRFQLHGHHPIALAGGATGMVGDPSGRSAERNLLTPDQVAHNIASIKQQLGRFLDFDATTNPARMVDNSTWTAPISFLEFLRDVGKHFSVNAMLAKESVRARLESESGISYTEFSYMLLQAHDFLHLRETMNCELQVGATDQWGNITAGTDLIRKKLGAPAWGLTFPLLTKSDGTKYGKSTSGAVYLDPKRTTPYRFYQFFVQAEDADVIKLLKVLTFLSAEEITALDTDLKANPGARAAQKALARAVTTLVHGDTECANAIRASEIMFGGGLDGISESLFQDVVGEIPTKELEAAKLSGAGAPLVELLVHAGLAPSKGQARKDIDGGGIYVNNARVGEASRAVTTGELLFGKYLLLRKGKRTYTVVKIV